MLSRSIGLKPIPCTLMRGGTSRGAFFNRCDLPENEDLRDRVLLRAMGSPHPLQVDGIGGGQSLTSKVAIIGPSTVPDADVDYHFAQVSVTDAVVDTRANCGNLLAAVAPYALEAGLVQARSHDTRIRIHNVNTGMIARAHLSTPQGRVDYTSTTAIDGAFGTAATVRLTFLNAQGAITGALFPTGRVTDMIDGIPVSLIDYSIPVMIVAARALGLTELPTPQALTDDKSLLARIEGLRLGAGLRMGMGDVRQRVTPKVALLFPPTAGGTVAVRYFTPWACHTAMAVTGATAIAVACAIEGSIAAEILGQALPSNGTVRIEHPAGTIDIRLSDDNGQVNVPMAGVTRTVRRLFDGHVMIPYNAYEAYEAAAKAATSGRPPAPSNVVVLP